MPVQLRGLTHLISFLGFYRITLHKTGWQWCAAGLPVRVDFVVLPFVDHVMKGAKRSTASPAVDGAFWM